jgi:hypothetical protein
MGFTAYSKLDKWSRLEATRVLLTEKLSRWRRVLFGLSFFRWDILSRRY